MKPPVFAYTTDVAKIPTMKVMKPCEPDPRVMYACPEACAAEHFEAWRRARRMGDTHAPEPMPYAHLMFERPTSYGYVPYGCTDVGMMRAAVECRVRGDLHGWDRDMTPAQLNAVVKATVDAKLAGVETGASPYLACIMANI